MSADREPTAADKRFEAGFFTRLTQANQAFRTGLPATLGRIEAAQAKLVPAAPAPQQVAELQALLHTLAGAAVTFGFRELGQGARALEQRLRVLRAFDAVGEGDWRAWLAELDEFIRAGRESPAPAYHNAAFSLLP